MADPFARFAYRPSKIASSTHKHEKIENEVNDTPKDPEIPKKRKMQDRHTEICYGTATEVSHNLDIFSVTRSTITNQTPLLGLRHH